MTNALNNIAIEDFDPAFKKVMDMTRFDTLLHAMFMVVKADQALYWYKGPEDARIVAQNLYHELYGLRVANKLTDSRYSISSGYLTMSVVNLEGEMRMSLSFNYELGRGYTY
jgi:catechol 2,3-dioxygenase-like lactoylglutathione lyase family enzyme